MKRINYLFNALIGDTISFRDYKGIVVNLWQDKKCNWKALIDVNGKLIEIDG